MLVADAREALRALTAGLEGWQVDDAYRQEAVDLDAAWQKVVDECYHRDHTPLPAQTEVFGALNELMGPKDVVINAAGSMPGDLQCLWRASTPEQYHVEYAFSCMGYEIPASLGVKLAVGDEQQVVAIVGDGTYQMLPMEIATIVSEGVKVIIVLLQNHGFASIGALSESRGSQRFGTKYRMRQSSTGRLDGEEVPFDLAANAASWGADVLRCAVDGRVPRELRRGRRLGPHDGALHRDRPLGPEPARLGLVGRPRLAGVGAGVHPAGVCRAPGEPARAARLPVMHRRGSTVAGPARGEGLEQTRTSAGGGVPTGALVTLDNDVFNDGMSEQLLDSDGPNTLE